MLGRWKIRKHGSYGMKHLILRLVTIRSITPHKPRDKNSYHQHCQLAIAVDIIWSLTLDTKHHPWAHWQCWHLKRERKVASKIAFRLPTCRLVSSLGWAGISGLDGGGRPDCEPKKVTVRQGSPSSRKVLSITAPKHCYVMWEKKLACENGWAWDGSK